MEMPENRGICGVAKLRSEIYVLFEKGFELDNVSLAPIIVFEDRYPFRLQTEIKGEDMECPTDIVSSEKANCLHVNGYVEHCVWKITRETDDQRKIIKWLTTNYAKPHHLSVSRDGELLIINLSSHSLMIYGSDAELIRSIPLTTDIKDLYHAVETSIGNFIIIDVEVEHEHEDEDEYENAEEEVKEEEEERDVVMEEGKQNELISVVSDKDEEEEKNEEDVVMEEGKHADWLESRQGKGGSYRRKMEYVVSELTSDGQMVIRRFIPSNETQKLRIFWKLSIDSNDRVYVCDEYNGRVILLDSDLKWNRILCPAKEEKEEQILRYPSTLFYDEEIKQLIVGGRSDNSQVKLMFTL